MRRRPASRTPYIKQIPSYHQKDLARERTAWARRLDRTRACFRRRAPTRHNSHSFLPASSRMRWANNNTRANPSSIPISSRTDLRTRRLPRSWPEINCDPEAFRNASTRRPHIRSLQLRNISDLRHRQYRQSMAARLSRTPTCRTRTKTSLKLTTPITRPRRRPLARHLHKTRWLLR